MKPQKRNNSRGKDKKCCNPQLSVSYLIHFMRKSISNCTSQMFFRFKKKTQEVCNFEVLFAIEKLNEYYLSVVMFLNTYHMSLAIHI